ncbi:DUF1272 domain-containing protein [uncultured Maribacter sp.]|uniref:DUF1272 domain-containing protein n=1 Tax=uncultured Maribacter sp. TaxID=431308 RepID=UPI002625C59D|nr:DUF1272 domain-containing protein [uncultured Maribacter sp.]
MLQIRPTCENCNKKLLPNSTEAMICTYECTFCVDCVTDVLHNVCPNCGGGFEKRPVRPMNELLQNPESKEVIYNPVNLKKFKNLLQKFQYILPNKR